jgi:segregation and condensation protein B
MANKKESNPPEQLQKILEAALMVAGRPLSVADLQKLFEANELPDTNTVRSALTALQESYNERAVELRESVSGFQFQARSEFSPWLSRLWEERAPRFSRALLETIALIAYRQPITRAEIEEIRGVAVSSNIIKTLQEREWIRVIGYRDVPGKPAMYATTKTFLDHLSLKGLDELPTLADLKDMESQEEKLQVQLELTHTPEPQSEISESAEEITPEVEFESETQTELD